MIRLFEADFLSGCDGVAVKDEQMPLDYVIIINKNLCMEEKVQAFRHELLHIIYKDFEAVESGVPVEVVERLNRERMRVLYNE